MKQNEVKAQDSQIHNGENLLLTGVNHVNRRGVNREVGNQSSNLTKENRLPVPIDQISDDERVSSQV